MGFFDDIANGLAKAQQEAARHITPENINRGLQMARDGIGHAAEQINQHVTPENINHGIRMAQEGFNVAAQQINQHVTPENINHGLQIARGGMNVAVQQINEHVTPENINHGLQMAWDGAGMITQQISQHVNQENIHHGAQIVRNRVGAAVQHIGQHATRENIDRARDEVRKAASGPAAQQVAGIVKQHPVPVAVASTGLLIAAVPAIITAPIMGIAGLMGFTSGGIAAASIASGAQAGMGSVAAGSSFAVMQSAAAGGYGLGILTGIIQAVGGVAAAVGGIGVGIQAWLGASAGKDAPTKATAHSETANAVKNDDIVGECSSINAATQDTGVVAGTITQLRKIAWENPLLTAATVVTGTGLLVVAAPAIVTAPLISLAGAAGFTSGGIAATSAATTVHASIGNVAAGSIFATLQSAAAGGYGVGVLTGAAQTAGGAVAGAGGLGGILAYLKKKGKSQPELTDEKKDQ
ncbi:hypothetical protein CFAM422_004231 [Trichoderma lentiforme]|uniref:Uncharacterized protein n=1 Tax=Trichoderma lentiforme TaxID=1567552 RepID=A0A9P4XIS5_9HYPO|nr:hypothetical protein CFAM422_004231 [Trichoderma lentiforme]